MLGRDHSPDPPAEGILADLYRHVIVESQSAGLILIRGIHINDQRLISCEFLSAPDLPFQKLLILSCFHKIRQHILYFHEQLILKLLLSVAYFTL